jgi:type I restriction enzyme S subunit
VSNNDDLPDGWKLVTMGAVADVVGGGTPKTTVAGNFTDEGGHPWITPADLTGYTDKYIARGRRNLTDQGLTTSSARYMPTGAVLYSTRAPIGYAAIAANPVTTNQGFRSFVPSPEVDPEYLYYGLKVARREAERLASGTTFAELSGTNAKKLHLALAPLDVQRQIVQLLDSVNLSSASARQHLAAARRAMERFRQVVLAAACAGRLTAEWREAHPSAVATVPGAETRTKRRRTVDEAPLDLDLPELPDSYALTTIGTTATVLEYGTSKKANNDVSGVPVLRMGNIQDGRLDSINLKYCASDRDIERLMLQKGDLLFNRTNSPELVGKAAVFHEATPMTFASYLIRVRFAEDVVDPNFANYWINSAWGRMWARHVKTDGVSQSNINGTKLGNMPLPLPPIEEQREIVRRASGLLAMADSFVDQLERSGEVVASSFQAVLAKAFRGELMPSAHFVSEPSG